MKVANPSKKRKVVSLLKENFDIVYKNYKSCLNNVQCAKQSVNGGVEWMCQVPFYPDLPTCTLDDSITSLQQHTKQLQILQERLSHDVIHIVRFEVYQTFFVVQLEPSDIGAYSLTFSRAAECPKTSSVTYFFNDSSAIHWTFCDEKGLRIFYSVLFETRDKYRYFLQCFLTMQETQNCKQIDLQLQMYLPEDLGLLILEYVDYSHLDYSCLEIFGWLHHFLGSCSTFVNDGKAPLQNSDDCNTLIQNVLLNFS